jgi:hypothetical protein
LSNNQIEDKEVTWQVLDITVYGTITSPKDNEIHSGVVLLPGSGPTDRNWCSPLLPGTNGTAKILAEELAKRGYVTLRYDKLGPGPHVKENQSSQGELARASLLKNCQEPSKRWSKKRT